MLHLSRVTLQNPYRISDPLLSELRFLTSNTWIRQHTQTHSQCCSASGHSSSSRRESRLTHSYSEPLQSRRSNDTWPGTEGDMRENAADNRRVPESFWEPRLYVWNTAAYKPALFSISSIQPPEPESSILIVRLIRIFMLLSKGLTLTKDFDRQKLQRPSLRANTVTNQNLSVSTQSL